MKSFVKYVKACFLYDQLIVLKLTYKSSYVSSINKHSKSHWEVFPCVNVLVFCVFIDWDQCKLDDSLKPE